MGRLKPEKLQVNFLPGVTHEDLTMPRRYTLTHSDLTGDLFLSIGSDYNYEQISGLYTRIMRDEVLAEWKEDADGMSLHVYCHVSGGIIFGRASWRESIFRNEMSLVLETIRYGDRKLFEANPELDNSPVFIHFQVSKRNKSKIEAWGTLADYTMQLRAFLSECHNRLLRHEAFQRFGYDPDGVFSENVDERGFRK